MNYNYPHDVKFFYSQEATSNKKRLQENPNTISDKPKSLHDTWANSFNTHFLKRS